MERRFKNRIENLYASVGNEEDARVCKDISDEACRYVPLNFFLIISLLGITMFVVVSWMPAMSSMHWLYPVAFFILGVAHSGVRLGRKTYIVDTAGGNRRTDYVAVSNTIIGVVLLITGGISAIASAISPEGIILILSIFGIAGAYTSSRLPEVEP